MAQRFGGKYSPGAPVQTQTTDPAPFDGQKPGPVGAKANLMFALPFPFLIKAFFSASTGLFVGLGTAGLLFLAAWLTRDGVIAHAAFDARKVAHRPAIPRKIFAACLTGAALMLATMGWSNNPIYPFLFGMLAALLHLGAFGLDPMKGKGMEGIDSFQSDRVAKAVDEAELYLAGMKDAILRARDPQLEARVDRFATIARGLFRTIEGDPGDLTAARKYLSVYLMGARDATVKFADVYAQNRETTARADYEALLGDLETNFASRSKALLTDNHSDLDVEIQVLRDRLKLEG